MHDAIARDTDELIATGRWMSARDLLPATSGNLSFRVSATQVAITASGCDKGELSPSDLLSVDIDGPVDPRASAETLLHLGEDEVRFFVEGSGSFYLHVDERVFHMVCTRDDLIGVPANTRHWFDMGTQPAFCAIRLFLNPAGWVAQFTGDPIAARFPSHDDALARLS